MPQHSGVPRPSSAKAGFHLSRVGNDRGELNEPKASVPHSRGFLLSREWEIGTLRKPTFHNPAELPGDRKGTVH